MRNLSPFKITVIYFLSGVLWILFSDNLLVWLVKDMSDMTYLQTLKGWIYILLTSVILYFMIRHNNTILHNESNRARSNEQTLRSILDTQFQLSGLLTPEGTTVFANQSALTLIGAKEQEVLGKPFWETPWWRKNPEQQKKLRDSINRAAKGESVRYEAHHIDSGNEIRSIDFSIRPVINEKHEIVFLVPEGRDITERKKAEGALRESENRVRTLKEQTSEAIFCFECMPPIPTDLPLDEQVKRMYDCILVECNDVCAKSYGKEHEKDVIGYKLTDLFGTIPGSLNELFTSMVQGGYRIVDGEGVEVLKDGTRRYYLNNAYGVIHDGSLVRVWGTFRDITDRRKAEEVLRASEERLKRAQEIAHLGSWELNLEENRLTWSDEVYRIFGCTPQEFDATYEAFLECVHPEDRAAVDSAYSSSIRDGRDTYEIEHRVIQKDNGDVRIVYERCEHLRDNTGRIISSIGMVHDITERKHAEEALKMAHNSLEKKVKERTAELLEKNRELEEFAYIASHDMQEPLRKIKLFSDMIQNELSDRHTDKSLDYLHRMIKAADRMEKLLRALLSYSRVSSKAPSFETVDLRSVAEDVIKNIAPAPGGLEPEIEIGDLPKINGDPVQMSLLFQNLLTNAIRYHKDGEAPAIKIMGNRISGKDGDSDNELYELRIEDDGIGFDMNFKERIFMPFERLHGRNKYEGTGIGLAICRKIVERHGGQIMATSKPGEGATFTVNLPVKQTFEPEKIL